MTIIITGAVSIPWGLHALCWVFLLAPVLLLLTTAQESVLVHRGVNRF